MEKLAAGTLRNHLRVLNQRRYCRTGAQYETATPPVTKRCNLVTQTELKPAELSRTGTLTPKKRDPDASR